MLQDQIWTEMINPQRKRRRKGETGHSMLIKISNGTLMFDPRPSHQRVWLHPEDLPHPFIHHLQPRQGHLGHSLGSHLQNIQKEHRRNMITGTWWQILSKFIIQNCSIELGTNKIVQLGSNFTVNSCYLLHICLNFVWNLNI